MLCNIKAKDTFITFELKASLLSEDGLIHRCGKHDEAIRKICRYYKDNLFWQLRKILTKSLLIFVQTVCLFVSEEVPKSTLFDRIENTGYLFSDYVYIP
jgi:hypothetical protein